MGRDQKSTTKLANEKSQGLNGAPPNAFKAFNEKNLTYILLFYNQFWNIQADFKKWHEGQVVIIPKKGDNY